MVFAPRHSLVSPSFARDHGYTQIIQPVLTLATQLCAAPVSALLPFGFGSLHKPLIVGYPADELILDHPIIQQTLANPTTVQHWTFSNSHPHQPLDQHHKLRSYTGIALVNAANDVWAVLAVYTTTARNLNNHQILHLTQLATTITAMLNDKLLHQHTIDEQRLRTVLQGLHIGILVENEHREIVVTNEVFCDLFNIPVEPEMLLGTDCSQAAEQSKHLFRKPEEFVARIDDILQQRQLVRNWELELTDGRLYTCDYLPIVLENRYRGHLWCYRDVTLMREHERQLMRQNHYLSTLHEMTLGIIRHLNIDDLLQTVVDKACELLHVPAGFISLWDAATQTYALQVNHGDEDPRYIVRNVEPDQGVIGEVVRLRQSVIIPDYSQWEKRIVHVTGLKALVGAPLIVRDEIMGVLIIASTTDRTFQADDVYLLEQYAQLATIALENAQLYTAMNQELAERRLIEQSLAENQAILQDFLDNASDLIQILDMQGRFIFTNQAWQKTLGYSEQELAQRTIHDLVAPEQHTQLQMVLDQLAHGIRPERTFTVVMIACDGRKVYLEGSLNCRFEQGKPVAIRTILRDFTERRQLQAEFNQRARHHNAMLSALSEGVMLIDQTGKFVEWNQSVQSLLGINSEQLTDMNVFDQRWQPIHRDGRSFEPDEFPVFYTLRTGKPVNNVILGCYRFDGEIIWLSFNTRALMHPETNTPTAVVASFHDITAQLDAEAGLLEAKEAAEQANRAKSMFLADMSHEFRTPLNAIIGYGELIQEQLTDSQRSVASDMQHIMDAGNHLLALVNDLLDMAKIESGQEQLNFEWLDLDEIIGITSEIAMPLMEKNQNDLIVTPLPEPMMIYGDQRRMHQVMLNLLSNAAKFTHNGTVTLSVQFNDTQEKRWIEISVQDTGIGMSSTQLEQLFQEFSQVHRKKRTTYEGTGLGLVISRKLCERMGGTIVVASNEGVGTTFTVRLPDHTMHD